MDLFQQGLETCRAAADECVRCAEACRAEGGMEDCASECERAESAFRAAVRDLGVGERAALSPAVSAAETCITVCEEHDHDHCRKCAEACRQAVATLRDVMALPGEPGPADR